MDKSEIRVTDIKEMVIICAELAKQNIIFTAKHFDDNSWIIIIAGY